MIKKEFLFKTSDGVELIANWWLPDGNIEGVVVIIHGLAEHIGRYTHLVEAFHEQRIAVAGFDLRGHGKSPGERIMIPSLARLTDDVKEFIELVQEEYPQKPLILFGHSMGSLILGDYATTYEPDADGLIFSALGLIPNDDFPPPVVFAARILSKIIPRKRLVNLESNSLSHDPKIVEDYDNDPLNYRGGIPACTGTEILTIGERIRKKMNVVQKPTLIIHGDEDKLANVEGSKIFYDHISSEDKTLKIYPGLYHELINEYEKEEIIAELIEWIQKRI